MSRDCERNIRGLGFVFELKNVLGRRRRRGARCLWLQATELMRAAAGIKLIVVLGVEVQALAGNLTGRVEETADGGREYEGDG